MGASAKRKKEKKKDFQKAKLKVGKTKAPASNFTDTSFKAKRVTLTNQSLSTVAPSATALFTHHLSLLTSKSLDQRRDSLSHLTNALHHAGSAPSHPTSTILPKLQPLLLDPSKAVRGLTLSLLQALPREDLAASIDLLLLYVRAGMTHLAPEIRVSALEVLEWIAEDELLGPAAVGAAAGWGKTLSVFGGLLGWKASEETSTSNEAGGNAGGSTAPSKGWLAPRASFGKAGGVSGDGRVRIRALTVLAAFLRAGLATASIDGSEACTSSFPVWSLDCHMIPGASRPFAHLNLFGAVRDDEGAMYEDRTERQRFFEERWRTPVNQGAESAKKEGGEVGRAAGLVIRAIEVGMEDFEGG